MNHETARELAALAAGGDLDQAEAEALAEHLASCAACAAEAALLRRSVAVTWRLATMLEPVAPPAPRGSARSRSRALLLVALPAALVAAVLAGVGLVRWLRPPVEGPASPPVQLVRVVLTPGDGQVTRIPLGPLPRPRPVCTSTVLPDRPAADPTPPPVEPPDWERLGPLTLAATDQVRARALLLASGRRFLPDLELVLEADRTSWLLREVSR
jgi:hypothetical protein